MWRTLGLGLLAAIFGVTTAAFLPSAVSDAATPAVTCTRAADGIYSCDSALAVGKHIAIKVDTRVCHANVLSAANPQGGYAAAKIVENVSSCPWPLNSVATFTFRVPAPPVSVGGVTEVYGSLASPGSASAWRDTIPLLALALLAFAGVAVGTRRWLAARRVR